MHPSGAEKLSALRKKIERIQEGSLTDAPEVPVALGVAAVDGALPWGGLKRGGLHEIGGTGGAGFGFLAALLKRAAGERGRILWCQHGRWLRETGLPYGPGLAAFGLAAGQFLFVRAEKDADALWAMEEGLRMGGLAAVVGDGVAADFTATRRLQLAAETTATPAFMLSPGGSGAEPRRGGMSAEPLSAALTRWRVRPRPGGAMRWQLELRRCRGGAPGNWDIEWDEQALRFRLAEALGGRAAAG